MTKVITDLELLKKLQPYLKEMITENVYYNIIDDDVFLGTYGLYGNDYIKYKTLTLEESIELLPKEINNSFLNFYYMDNWCINYEAECGGCEFNEVEEPKLFEATQKMLHYLVDNDLLGTNNK